jgi:hypothetical protein
MGLNHDVPIHFRNLARCYTAALVGMSLNSLRTEVFWKKKNQKMHVPRRWLKQTTNGTIRKCYSKAFQ